MYTRFPNTFIKELNEKTNLVQLAKQYTKLRKVGIGIWQGPCPHPNHNDSTPSFTIWENHNSWCCYGCHCGKKGIDGNLGSDAIAFISWVENIPFKKAVIKLAEWNSIPIPNDKNQIVFDKNYNLSIKYSKDLNNYEEALSYLYNRGLDDIDIEEWNIGYDYYNKRIVFPLFNSYKNILGFNKRTIDINYKYGDKYINSKASDVFNKSYYLYGIHKLDNSFNEIRITEGCLDVILAKKYGLKNVVATLGTSLTEHHVKEIAKTGKIPVLIYDGDEAGEKSVNRTLAMFESIGVYCKIVKLPEGKDLADVSLIEQFNIEKYIRKNSVTSGYLQIKNIVDEYNSLLYQVKLDITPRLEDIIKHVPKIEERVLKSYIKDEINISL